jgi:hypothetical protein
MDVDELVAQRAAGLVQPRLDRAGAGAEASGHLGVAEPAEVKSATAVRWPAGRAAIAARTRSAI